MSCNCIGASVYIYIYIYIYIYYIYYIYYILLWLQCSDIYIKTSGLGHYYGNTLHKGFKCLRTKEISKNNKWRAGAVLRVLFLMKEWFQSWVSFISSSFTHCSSFSSGNHTTTSRPTCCSCCLFLSFSLHLSFWTESTNLVLQILFNQRMNTLLKCVF